MGKTISFELQDEVYDALQQVALKSGRPFEELAIEWLARRRPRASMVTDATQASRKEMLRRAGNVSSGNPNAADNDQIDSDLSRAYEDHGGSSGAP